MTERLQAIDNPAPGDLARLEDQLDAFNTQTTGIFDARLLTIILKHAGGEIYAGLHGHTWGQTCEIKVIWIAEANRGQGLGADLLRAAEAEARARGCRQIVLSTHSFQAPAFYEKEGYRSVATVPDYPAGHAHILMVKHLTF